MNRENSMNHNQKFPVIANWLKQSLIDHPENLSTILFLKGCNLKCGYCHNQGCEEIQSPMWDFESFFQWLKSREKWIDAIVISGGEPSISDKTENLLEKLREYSVKIKMDTNGLHPEKLRSWISKKLVDSFSMDIKTELTPEHYSTISGISIKEKEISLLKESIEILNHSENEFRTTLIQGYHHLEMAEKIAPFISQKNRYTVQKFQPELTLTRPWKDFKSPTNEFIEKWLIPFEKKGILCRYI